MNNKLALAMIVKGSDQEAIVLDRCLKNVSPNVDAIYITITQKNKKVEEVCKKYKAVISHFEWCNDFAKARNYNFSQVPKEYNYILWLDADDVLRGGEKLKATLNENKADCYSLNYLYAFDEYNNPTVVHQKTQIVKNGCVEWAGRLHEDFTPLRKVETYFIKGIERLHLSNEDRFAGAKERNLEVARGQVEAEPDDPRSYWNLGNALKALNNNDEAIVAFEKFLTTSLSDDEKYIVRLRMAEIYWAKREMIKAVESAQYAIGLKPEYPDAYHLLGSIYYEMKDFKKAEKSYTTGITKKPPYMNIIVYNPRDYDYVPLMNLAKVYFNLSRPDLALICLESCKKIQPKDNGLDKIIEHMKTEKERLDRVLEWVKKLQSVKGLGSLKKMLDSVPEEFQSHPAICNIRNVNFKKIKSSGKDLVFFCGFTEKEWTPETAKTKGVGGSEEAVIWLSQLLTKEGWNVTVYNNCGHKEKVFDGVTYKPFWAWNYRDKQDVTILWRSPKMCDYEINSKKVIIDLHDVIPSQEFTEERLERIDKVFVKSQFHASLFPNIPEDKMVVIPNGIDSELFKGNHKKDDNLMVYTSSPDRGLATLVELFPKIKEQVPEARLQWAYGWDIFDIVHKEDAKIMEWKKDLCKKMEDYGVEVLGRVSHPRVAEMYKEAKVFAYPSEFAEIDCISLSKAIAAGAYPVTTDFAAMGEKNFNKDYIKSEKNAENWCLGYQYDFSLKDEKQKQEFVDKCVKALKGKKKVQRETAYTLYDWNNIAYKWNKHIK